MPFKLRLKKSRQYNVVSKSLFVICIEHLDGGTVECTLDSDSTGRDCLDNVCQKLGLGQPEFFGLQYTPRNPGTGQINAHWLEMERPLKKQLDKYAANSNLYLRVMFYIVNGVGLLTDETSRNHYFLQLKLDVIEGRIATSPQQAVLLASYSMQAEFGSYDSERHTADYLKDFVLFPKHMTESEGMAERLTEAAILQHATLRGMPPGTAEERYIATCQRLDGYGQETFVARDDAGREVYIAISLTGITIRRDHANSTSESKFYPWHDISNVINHKRYFTIECTEPSETVHFHLADADSAKHVWRMCVHQHTFHSRLQISIPDGGPTQANNSATNFERVGTEEKLNEAHDMLDCVPSAQWLDSSALLAQRAQSTSCLDLTTSAVDVERMRALLPSYRRAPDYETAVRQKYAQQQQQQQQHAAQLYSSQPEIRQTVLHYPDVTHNNIEHRATAGAILHPLYSNAHVGFGPKTNSDKHLQQQQQHAYIAADIVEGMRLLHLYKPPPPYPTSRLSSSSTPDLAVASQSLNIPVHPYTAGIGHVSGSSPDLVSTRTILSKQYLKQLNNQQVPYEHIQHTYVPTSNAAAHGTYENLASILDGNNHYIAYDSNQQPAVIVENRNVTKHIQKVYDERGNIIYCMPALAIDNQHFTAAQHGYVVAQNQQMDDVNEPIYENVPLPWQNEAIRERTQSIQSAPEMLPILNQSIMNAVTNIQSRASLTQQQENVYVNLQNCLPISVNNYISAQDGDYQYTLANRDNNVLRNNETNSNHASRQNINSVHNSTQNIQNVNTSQNINSVQNISTDGKLNDSSVINDITVSHETPVQHNSSYLSQHSSNVEDRFAFSSTSVNTSQCSGSTVSSKEKKRKRWALFNKSGDKVKSATLGREKTKEKVNLEQKEQRQHRWSTGLPRQQPLPPTISKETMCQLLERKLVDSQLFFEFEKIPKKKQNADFTTALHADNAARNRFKDVLPYEENRVRLTPTRDNKHGYVNASHITATVGTKQRFYIAAQGPNSYTLESFWHCVWEADIYLIVQLTDSSEDIDYVPKADQRCLNVGQYQVWSEFSQSTGHCATSKLRLCNTQSRHYRSVWHMQYTQWGEQGCPNSPHHFLGFLEELRSVREHSVNDIPTGHNRNPPTLVHCTAGVGRTGVTILSDLLLYTLDHNQDLDVPRAVSLLRHQRAHMVQTVAQYRFVYSLLIHYLKQTRLI